jgi:hypothetical protein
VELYLHSPNIASWRGAQLKKEKAQGRMEEMRNAYNILIGKSEGKRPLGSLRRR